MKKLLTLILAFMATTATLFASSGTCGEDVTWDLTGGVLTISGTGPMEEFPKETDAPWYSERESIISVIIENGVTTVGRKAFMSYSTITSITLPESLTAIGDDAFRTASIESITIPANVASIGNLTFRWCTLLKTINVLPTTPPTLGTLPFSNIASDYVIYVPAAAFGAYKTADGWKDLNIQTEGGSSSSGTCGENVNWVLVGGVLTISGTGDMADYASQKDVPWYDNHADIYTVTIGNGVTTIGQNAFYDCINVTSATIPSSVTTIKDYGFFRCTGLTKITCEATTPPTLKTNVFYEVDRSIPVYVPKGYISAYQAADYWNEFTNIQAIPDGTFGPCGENVNWDLTDGVFTISGSGPMTDYKSSSNVPWRSARESITSIVIENGVTSIGDYAFYYCRHLPSVTIPSSITSIGASALERCTGLKEITCEATTPPTCGADAFNYITNDIPVSVPAGTDNLYRAADGWKELNIKGVASGTCGENVNWELVNDVLTISGTGYMTSYTSPSKRPWNSFASFITSVVIEEGVMNIGESAFEDFSSLTSVTIPNSLEVIEGYAFFGCSALSSVTIPDNIMTIGNSTFKYCSALTTITIPANVNYIKYQAFSGCTGLTEIICEATTPPTCEDLVFEGVTNTIPVYVPAESVSAYKSADGWNYFENIQAKGAGTNEIYAALSGSTMTIYYDDQKASRPGALDKWTPEDGGWDMDDATRETITKAVISPSMVDALPTRTAGWFFNLANLTTIEGLAYLNTSEVTNMGFMFVGCSSLTSLDLSSFNTANVRDMIGMFQGCESLTSLNLSGFNTAKVTDMSYMFSGCSSLKTIYCDEDWSTSSATSDNMFYGCTSLVGGKGTKYDDGKTDKTYARPDGLDGKPGYFTANTYTGEAWIDGINYYLDGSDMTAQVIELGGEYYAGDIVIPEKVSYIKNDYTVTSVSSTAFSNCPELLSVTFPKSVNWIEPEAFFGSTKLTAVNVVAANADYSSLDGVLFNKAQSELIAYPTAKEGAYIVPEGVETIMDVAFAENTHLTAVTLPESLDEIASLAFQNCTGLEMITSRASAVPSLGSDVFVGVNKAIPVFVPKASIALYKAEFGWEDFTNYIAIEDKEAADAVIAKINAIGTVTYTPECKARIDAARGGYDALTAEQKVYITDATYKILTDAEQAYADLKAKAEADQAAANAVIGKIDAIGTVTLESEAAILDARSAYDALTATQKLLVTNYSVLTAAEAKLEILKKQAESDEAAAKAVTDLINAIGTVTYTSESKARIDAAREAYDALTAAQKALVTNLTTLTAAEKAYADLKAKAEADQAAANIVIGKINAIGTVTYTPESKALIDAAREAYDALTDAQKGLVSSATYKILTDAEQTYADLKKKADADLAAASIVIGKINAIGTVTLSSEAAILDARSAYDALTAAQKVLVTNYGVLTAAEKAYADLKAQAEADQAAANAVIVKIDAIGDVTLASEPAIVAARSAYNALTAGQKALVTNYGVLTAAEAKLEILKKQAESDEAAAHAVTDLIDAIGTVTLESEAAITAARSAYEALTATQKLLVTNLGVLTAAEKKLAELKANAEAVENAKLQLKNIVSQANELKMVAMLYAPTAVSDIDAIINDAQSTIDDPNATVDQINAKAATLTDNLNTLAVNLLEQAKEQLKQSLRDLYQPGDYPSWYATVIIPALDQVDGITWDFNKSVQDNILYFQVTGQNLYNATKAALEALRGTDKRSIISSCAFTGFENGIKADMTWNIKALNALVANLNASVAAEPYRLDAEMSSLGKWDPVNEELVILDPYEAQKLTAGDYQFITAVKIDGKDAKQYRLPKATEAVLSVTVDAAVWSVDLSGIVIDANYSFTYVTSPMFTISKSEDVELVNEDQLKTQKIYHNGHFYILRGEHIYTIQGTLVR